MIYMRTNRLGIWYSCSSLVTLTTIETKSSKKKKANLRTRESNI